MKFRDFRGFGRHFHHPDDFEGGERGERGGRGGRGFGRGFGSRHRGGRMFDYGELRLLVLALIAGQPRHGYELIKAIEERLGGAYSPSPGVIYPTLAWLDDMGYAAAEADEGGRKRYRITAEGEAFLAANKAAADDLLARGGNGSDQGEGAGFARGGRWAGVPVGIVRGMENLKLALRLRIRGGTLDAAAAEKIAAALDEAARAIEKA